MEIYFLRHASAGDKKLPGKKDEKRPIDARGEQQSHQVGRLLQAMEVKPDAIISSPLTRAMQTAHIVAEELGFGSEIELNDGLRPDASFDDFEAMLRDYSKATTIIVTGHNPNLSEFLSLVVTNGATEDAFDLKKGGVAKIERKKQSAVLHWCLTPKLVSAAYELATTNSRPNTSRK
jgi:phosphohistidine phosphatase